MRRLLAQSGGFGILFALLAISSIARADAITLNRYVPAETIRDGFALSRPDDHGRERYGFDLQLDYANDPLVLELLPGDTDSEAAAVVSDQLVGHVSGWVGLWDRLVIFVGADVNLVMQGDSFRDPATGVTGEQADGTTMGDVRLGARVRLLGENDDFFSLAGQLTATVPVATTAKPDQRFSGESTLTIMPELLAEMRPGPLKITLNAGIDIRKNQELGRVALGHELTFGLGLTVNVVEDRLDFIGEVFGNTALSDFGNRESTPLEFLAGGKLWVSKVCAFGAAGGAGLLRGVGAPDFRVVGMFGCDLPDREAPNLPEAERDHDLDRDRDGLLDRSDTCPDDPEDKDKFQDSDGCPDSDNDKDGVRDVRDDCPMDPEDTDDFDDKDGCPDPDNDEDGLIDVEDSCPSEPEDKDDFEDADGCHEPDNDKDRVLDVDDSCPTAPGVPEAHGCPKSVRVEGDRILILERVEFATNKDEILKRSEGMLDEVRATIEANPQIAHLRIEGHTDDRGNDKANLALSKRRGASVVRWLSERGIESPRMQAYGCGETRPSETNATHAGRQANRRVEFHIVDPKKQDDAESESCEASDE